MFTPANIGGDAYRFFNLRRDTNAGNILALLVVERVLGLIAYLITFLVSLTYVWLAYPKLEEKSRIFFTYAGLSVGLALIALLVLPRLIALFALVKPLSKTRLQLVLMTCLDGISANRGKGLFFLLGYSVLAVMLWIFAVGVIAKGLGIQPGWAALGVTAVLAELIRLVPITLHGIGLRESAYAFLFSMLGQQPEHGFVLGTVCYIVLNFAALAVGTTGFLIIQFGEIRLKGKG